MAQHFFNQNQYIPGKFTILLCTPQHDYDFLNISESVADDVMDLLQSEVTNGTIPVSSVNYKVIITSLQHVRQVYNINITTEIYNKIVIILRTAGSRYRKTDKPQTHINFNISERIMSLLLRLDMLES